jgi:hypothetical protein
MVGKALTTVSLSVTLAGWIGAATAHADNVQNLGTYAGDVVKQLQDWGYNVMINGLSRDAASLDDFQKRHCQVLGTHPAVGGPLESGDFQTVYVDLSCQENNSTTSGI